MKESWLKALVGLLFALGQAIAIGAATFAWKANADLAVMQSKVADLEARAKASNDLEVKLAELKKEVEFANRNLNDIKASLQ